MALKKSAKPIKPARVKINVNIGLKFQVCLQIVYPFSENRTPASFKHLPAKD